MPRAASSRASSASLPLASRSTLAASTVSGRRSRTARTACRPYRCWRRLATAASSAARLARVPLVLDGNEVDLALFDVDGDEPDLQRLGQAVFTPRALAFEDGPGRILVIVVARQRGHVHEAVGLDFGQTHEQ